jgi:hypothetical protein
MQLSIIFNTKPDLVHVTFGMYTVKDMDFEFRVGLIKKEESDRIYWFEEGWFFEPSAEKEIKFNANRGDKITVERKKKPGDSIEIVKIWDTQEDWPPEAYGDAVTVVSWYF